MQVASPSHPVLLYDGICGFCSKVVQIILDRDKRGTLCFASLQSDYGKSVVKRHPILKDVDSLAFIEISAETGKENVFVRSTAALHVASYLGGMWKLFLIAYLIPRPLRDAMYDLFAKSRYSIFGKLESCKIPSSEDRSRFLDLE
jgi:predicted DCC family thiol-disulfide oxidoreductase YuxK